MSYEIPESHRILLPTSRPPEKVPTGFQYQNDENVYYDINENLGKPPQGHSKFRSVIFSVLFLLISCLVFLLFLQNFGYFDSEHQFKPSEAVTTPSTMSSSVSRQCVLGYTKFDQTGFCYKKIYHKSDFNGAQRACESEEANLASIHSEEENEFLADLSRRDMNIYDNHSVLGLEQEIWIGLHYVSGKWEWIDGTPVDYEKWAVGEPNRMDQEVQVTMVSSKLQGYSPNGSHWNNAREFTPQKGLICKKAAV